jgi:hypothetical protein
MVPPGRARSSPDGATAIPAAAASTDPAPGTPRRALRHVLELGDVPPPIADEARDALTALAG